MSKRNMNYSFLQKTFERFVSEKESLISGDLSARMQELNQSYPATTEVQASIELIRQQMHEKSLSEFEIYQIEGYLFPELLKGGFQKCEQAFYAKIEDYINQRKLPNGFKEKFLQPVKYLVETIPDTDNTKFIFELLTEYGLILYGQAPHLRQPYLFNIEALKDEKAKRALEWTIVEIGNLDIPGLKYNFIHPYRQCWWCGSLLDEQAKAFPLIKSEKQKKYCHASGCKHDFKREPTQNTVDCCSYFWDKVRNNFFYTLQKLYKQEPDLGESQEKAVKFFKNFLNRRFERNLEQKFAVIRKDDAEFDKLLSEMSESTSYETEFLIQQIQHLEKSLPLSGQDQKYNQSKEE